MARPGGVSWFEAARLVGSPVWFVRHPESTWHEMSHAWDAEHDMVSSSPSFRPVLEAYASALDTSGMSESQTDYALTPAEVFARVSEWWASKRGFAGSFAPLSFTGPPVCAVRDDGGYGVRVDGLVPPVRAGLDFVGERGHAESLVDGFESGTRPCECEPDRVVDVHGVVRAAAWQVEIP